MSLQADNQMLQIKVQPYPEYLLALQKLIDRSELLQRELQQQLPELLEDRSTETQYFDEYLNYLSDTLHEVQQYSAIGEIRAKKRVAFGGAFSAGKSSLINALIGEKRLVVEIDPTTSIPTYVCAGEAERITAINLFQRSVELAQAEFASLTHDEQVKHGTHIGGLLRMVVIQMPSFGWQHLALLDTPGYSKPTQEQLHERTDADIAYEQLNSADCIVWVVSAAAGVISEDELAFLARLDADIPKLVVLNRADSKPAQDLADIQALVQRTLQQNNIDVVGVVTASARKPKDYPLTGLVEWLGEWDQPVQTATQSLEQSIKAVLGQLHEQVRYAHYELQHVQMMQTDTAVRFDQEILASVMDAAQQQQQLLVDAEAALQGIEQGHALAKIADFADLATQQAELNKQEKHRKAEEEARLLQKQAEDTLRAAELLKNKPPRRSLERIIESREDDIRRHKSDIYVIDDMYSSKVATKVSKARDTYAENAYEDALVLVDMSLFGSGNAGLYLTSDTLFFKKPAGEAYAVHLSDIKRIRNDADDCELYISSERYTLGEDSGSGSEYLDYITSSRAASMDALVECINEYINQDK